MAMIKCPECGKDVSNRATTCPNCGFPIDEQEGRITTPRNGVACNTMDKRKRIKPWLLVFIIVGAALLLLFIGLLTLGASVSADVNETKANIMPYLDYIGAYVPDGKQLDIDDALKENQKDVVFMGMRGRIVFDIEDNYVYRCTWKSSEEFGEEDYQKKVDDLYLYFGEEPTYSTLTYHTGKTYFYYWTDPNNNFSVTCSRNFIMYGSTGRLEIEWEAEGNALEMVKEGPNNIIEESEETDESEEEERAEANDYGEFKYAVDVCIEYIPDCTLDLDYTDNDTSYSINLDDEIIGILGTEMDSWDVVALIDPDKEDALLHHEQISIALIMACDSDITYEDAKKIFDKATEEGSARISSGIYFFEGMAEGMYAGAVDITWLD